MLKFYPTSAAVMLYAVSATCAFAQVAPADRGAALAGLETEPLLTIDSSGFNPNSVINSINPNTNITNTSVQRSGIDARIGETRIRVSDDEGADQSFTGGNRVELNGNRILATGRAIEASNSIDVTGAPNNEVLLGNINISGNNSEDTEVTSTVANVAIIFEQNQQTTSESNDVDVEVNLSTVQSEATSSFATNAVSGDFSELISTGTGNFSVVSGVDGTNPTPGIEGGVVGDGNILVANLQHNESVVNSLTENVFVQIDFDTGTAFTDFEGTLEVLNNNVNSLARGNVASNSISGENDGVQNGFAISSVQNNVETVSALVDDVFIGVDATGLNLTGPVAGDIVAEVSNNTVRATAIGNQVVNRISLGGNTPVGGRLAN